MTEKIRGPGLLAVSLVIFILALALVIWLLDFISQQRVFGLLVSAEFIAFCMLVYLYYEDSPQGPSRKWLLSGAAALAVLVLLGTAVFAGVGTGSSPNVNVTLYAGEISTSQLGFGNSSNAITSPGPPLTFKMGNTAKITVVNAGQMPHNFAIVNANASSAPVLFNAQIASAGNPLLIGQSGEVTFTVTQAGNFFYLCQVPGHLQLGMWGSVVVNP
jgi:uncharacterized cupredoxin-like copper-binding protein